MLLKKFKTFYSLSHSVKWLFFKAMAMSLVVKSTFLFRPFKRILSWLGKANVECANVPNPESEVIRANLKTAMFLCTKYALWKTECYSQAVTCKLLLNQYRIPSTIYIGFYKDIKGKYKGHAWLRSYDKFMTGGTESERFTVQSYFS